MHTNTCTLSCTPTHSHSHNVISSETLSALPLTDHRGVCGSAGGWGDSLSVFPLLIFCYFFLVNLGMLGIGRGEYYQHRPHEGVSSSLQQTGHTELKDVLFDLRQLPRSDARSGVHAMVSSQKGQKASL